MRKNITCSNRSNVKQPIRFLFLIGIFAYSIFPANTIAGDEDYLNALEAEAEDSAKLGSKREIKKKSKTESILNKEEFLKFEAVLEFSRPTTYRFYKKLKSEDKRIIFSIYRKDYSLNNKKVHALKTTAKAVLDLYFERNQ